MKPLSQCARVVAVLSDFLWHSIEEIHEQAGTMRLNSRIAELRAQGYVISPCERRDGTYWYRLLSTPGVDEPCASSPAAGNGASPQPRDHANQCASAAEASATPDSSGVGFLPGPGEPAPPEVQLSLFEAAA